MSNLVTLSSPDTLFTTFNLDSSIGGGQVLTQVQNLIDSGRPAGLLVSGPEVLAHADDLRDIECRGLLGPRANLAGRIEAATRTGYRVTLAYTLGDNTARSTTGIITDLSIRISGGKYGQEATFTFHEIDCLRILNSDTSYGTCSAAEVV